MVFYLGSPGSQMHAHAVMGMPVLVSFGAYCGASKKADFWIDNYIPTFGRVLIDSGAFSELNSGKKISLSAYADWAEAWRGADGVDAIAALDVIDGDWERGLENWRAHPWMFPTYHSADPPEVLDEILKFSPSWLGLGMVPPRDKARWLDETLERIPPGIHVHGWALGAFSSRPRLDSCDSTNWFRDALDLGKPLPWLTLAERVELIVKREQRVLRVKKEAPTKGQTALCLD